MGALRAPRGSFFTRPDWMLGQGTRTAVGCSGYPQTLGAHVLWGTGRFHRMVLGLVPAVFRTRGTGFRRESWVRRRAVGKHGILH